MRALLTSLLVTLPLLSGSTTALAQKAAPAAAPAASAASGGYQVGDRLPQAGAPAAKPGFKETTWEALVPKDWDPAKLFKDIDLSTMQDGDPRAMEALDKLRAAWDDAPVERSLNGARVRIPGFMVPIESAHGQVTEFLLVPYFGACVHTPPPPANQILHVFPKKPLKNTQMMDAIWVSGTLETVRSDTEFGKAGYRMRAEVVAPYKEKQATGVQ
jgi:hypothetical protein